MGPSALDWVLMGDDGSVDDSTELLRKLNSEECKPGRSHWGVTVLQAIEEFDAGPVWAYDQFSIDIDSADLTKSELYRGPVTQAAINATLAAISRIQIATTGQAPQDGYFAKAYPPSLKACPSYRTLSVSNSMPFQGGKLHHRPLLKAAQRDFDVTKHTSQHISRCIRCSDSQPGALSKVFGRNLYVYGGMIEDNVEGRLPVSINGLKANILGFRNDAICLATSDGKGVWVTHVRRPKTRNDFALWPKTPAISGLLELQLISYQDVFRYQWPASKDWSLPTSRTFQEVWVEMQPHDQASKVAYLYFDFYNGAMSTSQCSHLIEAMDYIMSQSTADSRVEAVVLMGGAYFSNGIALNVIEAAECPETESWLNINRIDDVVHYLLHEFPSRNILTIAAVRGNAAAGGVALAAACDVVIAGAGIVLNPAYRAVGLFGSEYHTLSYFGRCGATRAQQILRTMTPISAHQAQVIGLVDFVFPGTGSVLTDYVQSHITYMLKPGILKRGAWKVRADLSPAGLARARAYELGEMSKDFWSARSTRYHLRRFAFVRKVKPSITPLRFAQHRRKQEGVLCYDEEELDSFDSIAHFERAAELQLLEEFRKQFGLPDSSESTPSLESVASPESTRSESSTLFSCYYRTPVSEDVPSPPKTPLHFASLSLSNLDRGKPFSVPDIATPPLSPFMPMRFTDHRSIR